MSLDDLLDTFRFEVEDRAEPYLWGDDWFFGALDDAQKQFARKTDGIPDSTTTAIVEIPLVVGTVVYNLDPRILKIRSARRGDNGRAVDVLNQEDMPGRNMFFDTLAGPVKALITGLDDGKVSVWPVPNETVTVKLSVFRLPLLTVTDTVPLEIGEQHHRHLLMWVKHLAYSVPDIETRNDRKAADFEAAFEAYCFKAKLEQARLRHKPRAVAYGGL